jgi:carboxypeptidase family protein
MNITGAARTAAVGLALVLAATVAAAQTSTGQISGTIKDSSSGVLPGVTVTVMNLNTSVTTTTATGGTGTYVVTNLPVGSYSVTAELQGFRTARKSGFELTADGRITADFSLGVGPMTETVQVAAVRGEVVNRTSGEIARVIDGAQVRELALSGRNYLELASLIPGAVMLDDDQMAVTSGLGTGGTVINGNRGNSNNLTVDGGFNLDSGSNASMINNVGIDFIEQVAIQTSNFAADKGRNSGASINVVTKSGTNRFSGSGFETLRNHRLDAANYFAPRDANGKTIKSKLDFNDYGASFGGPVLKNRLFFFGGVEFKSLDRQESPQRRTLPTLAELRGDFSGRSVVIRDPLTGLPFPGNVIPQNRITTDGRAIAKAYEAMIGRATLYNSTPTSNNATYQLDFPFDWRQDILRFDYRPSASHGLYLRYLHDTYDLIEPRGTFIGAALPTISTRRIRPGYGYQIAHSWTVSPHLINEIKANASWNGQRVPPYGDAWRRDTYGFAFPQVFGGGQYDDGIPDVSFSGTGAPAALTGPSRSLLSPTTDITLQDSATWLGGRHALRLGFLVTRNRKDQNGRLAHTGAVNFNVSGNPNSTGFAFADALLGNFRSYSEGADDPIGFFRFTQYSAYASDNWRVRPNLSLELGVRYELASPIYTQGNNITNFDPDLYNPAAAVTLNRNGSIVPGSGTNRFTGLITAGDGVPADQQNRVAIDESAAALIPAGAPRGLYDTHHLFMPRFSGAYTVSEEWVVRGGVGLFYDRPEGNIIFSQVNLPPFVPSVSVENANLADPLAGHPSAVTVLGGINAIDPHLQVPRQVNYSLSLQRELAAGHFMEVAYVGNRGRHLLWQPEINQASFEALAANQALPSAQRANTNFLRPYKGYSSIRQRRSDAFADYNSLQLYLNKRKGTVHYTVSYTLAKATGLGSGNGDNPLAAEGFTPGESFDRSFFVGPTSYDRRHALVATWTYEVPFLRERRDLIGAVLGGWELTGKTRWQSGAYLTIDGSTSIGTRRADYLGGPISLPSDERSGDRWFNTDVFAAAPDTRRGTARVGQVEGPHLHQWDLSLRKNFRLRGTTKVNLRADVFNVFNRVNFNNPENTVTSSAFGQIGSAKIPRQVQLSLRIEF